MTPSEKCPHVFLAGDGEVIGGMEGAHALDAGWYFWDEVGQNHHGPYESEAIAIDKLDEYGRTFLGSSNAPTAPN